MWLMSVNGILMNVDNLSSTLMQDTHLHQHHQIFWLDVIYLSLHRPLNLDPSLLHLLGAHPHFDLDPVLVLLDLGQLDLDPVPDPPFLFLYLTGLHLKSIGLGPFRFKLHLAPLILYPLLIHNLSSHVHFNSRLLNEIPHHTLLYMGRDHSLLSINMSLFHQDLGVAHP